MSTQSTEDEFTTTQLPLLSPFEPMSVKVESTVSRKGQTYDRYVVTIVPDSNKTVKAKVPMFKSQYDQIRAIRFLNPKAHITATRTADGKGIVFAGVTPV